MTIFIPLLAVSLIVLKLLGLITWSWALVLIPLWGPITISILIFLGLGLMMLVVSLLNNK